MKPGFALSLSPDGISLLHRAAGGWRLVGSVELDSSDLSAALANLRALAERLEPGPISCKLIIPNSQIRYLTLDTGLIDDGTRMDMARAALDGATPYAVNDLAFDLSQDGPLTHVAAVAIETLEEAEAFARTHGFGPTSFVAAPGDMGFLGEPFFGTARAVRGTDVEPDGIAVVNIGPALTPEAAHEEAIAQSTAVQPGTDTEIVSTTTRQTDPIPLDNTEPGPLVGFSSRRHKPENGAPSLQGASRTYSQADVPSPAAASAPVHQDSPDQPWVGDAATQVLGAATVAPSLQNPSTSETGAPTTQTSAPSVPTRPNEDTATAAPIVAADNVFSSRRQTIPPTSKAPQAQSPAALTPAPDKPESDPFALPEPRDVGGKPRFLGLTLIAVLLLVMAAVAAWAVFIDPALFSVSRDGSATEISNEAAVPQETVQPETAPTLAVPSVETTPDQLPEIIAPQVSALPENLTAKPPLPAPEPRPDTALTSTDIAVLDALQDPAQTDLDLEAVADGILEPQIGPPTELSQAAQYAAVGIWQSVPQVPDLPAVIGLNNLYVASIDNTDLSQDAVALPPLSALTNDLELDSVISPAAAGNAFDLDERGLVRATLEGTINPDGVLVFLGRPRRVPPPTPDRPDPEAEAQINEQRAVLARLRPRVRPDDLVEQAERAQLGGLSLAELGQKRPRVRPASSRPANENSLPTTEQAIAISVVPKARPVNFANLVDRAQRNTDNPVLASAAASTAGILNRPAVTPNAVVPITVTPTTVTPSIPTSASVARQATMENAINLRQVNLIGVYGTPSNRRALVRLSSGRYKKVKVGDKIDGGQIVAIGESELRYQKGSRNLTLKIPNG